MPANLPPGGCEQFFESNYRRLREQGPMKWMVRLFLQLTEGRWPRLVDLPTGAGKTDLVVIWALALAWYGLDPETRTPVPRRLVWIVNRRVLVQQVFDLARELQDKLSVVVAAACELSEVREGLARLSGSAGQLFRVVQLRGQLVDDREWSVTPSVPSLIIGTVDQIGSRLLFQGYGLGKYYRPLQAAMLAVDAWVCVDEAHLVPAFVLTLRQFDRLAAGLSGETPQALSSVFERLPRWVTELSATPALPPPKVEFVFRLLPSDEDDPSLKDRLLAAQTRQIRIVWLGKADKLEEALEKAAAELAGSVATVAVFVRKAKDAAKITKGLKKQFKEGVLQITGRVRGYERDRLQDDPVFQRFRPRKDKARDDAARVTVFLVGTAAAEVGLDADADAVVCDFASLTTLIQRLGRLDRLGRLSRRAHDGDCEPPTMTIVAERSESKREMEQRILTLARELRATGDEIPASVLVGSQWNEATVKEEDKDPDEERAWEGEAAEAGAGEHKKAKRVDPSEVVGAATWTVLLGRHRKGFPTLTTTRSPNSWLKRPIARVTSGPVAVPPLTAALVAHWSATSNPRSPFLPVHPFLYGILPDDEGVPLVGIAFRLEMDALLTSPRGDDGEEGEEADAETQVKEILQRFPLRRAELHFVPLPDARDWLSSEKASEVPIARFDGEDWSVTWGGKGMRPLRPDAILALPTLTVARADLEKVLDDTSKIACSDVLEGVSKDRSLYRRRVVQIEPGDYQLRCQDGAAKFERTEAEQKMDSVPFCGSPGGSLLKSGLERRLSRSLRIGTATFRFEYWKPERPGPVRQLLDDHLAGAQEDARSIAAAVVPDSEFLRTVLEESAKRHDVGKKNTKWQHAMGNPDMTAPVAKPLVDRPSPLKGYRHEWQSLLDIKGQLPPAVESYSEGSRQLWLDLWRHLIGSHHGNLRPWLPEKTLDEHPVGRQRQSALRLESAERFARLQRLLGPWRLAYLEALLKAADVAASRANTQEESDEQ
jgi:CRISPR-associated endonuclease/helicase Cas3